MKNKIGPFFFIIIFLFFLKLPCLYANPKPVNWLEGQGKENLIFKTTHQDKSSANNAEEDFAHVQLLTEKVITGDKKGGIIITMTTMPAIGSKKNFASINDFKRTWVDPQSLSVKKTTHVNIDPKSKEESVKYKAWLEMGVDDFSGQKVREIHSKEGGTESKPQITELTEDYPVYDLSSLIQVVRKWNTGTTPKKI